MTVGHPLRRLRGLLARRHHDRLQLGSMGALEIYVEGLADGSVPTSLTRGAGQQAFSRRGHPTAG